MYLGIMNIQVLKEGGKICVDRLGFQVWEFLVISQLINFLFKTRLNSR